MGNSILRGIDVPFSNLLNNFFARRPKEVDGVANTSSLYYREWLLKKLLSKFPKMGLATMQVVGCSNTPIPVTPHLKGSTPIAVSVTHTLPSRNSTSKK